MSPNQKFGVDTPIRETKRVTWSGHLFLFRAATIPRGTPKTNERKMLNVASSKVAGKKFLISSATGRSVRIEVPRSPRAM